MSPRGLVVHAVLVGALAGHAAADPFPFVEGVQYEYEYVIPSESGTYRSFFSGTALVGGADVRVQRREGGPEHGTQSFWSENEEGDKFSHGAQHRFASEPYLFTPPILVLDAPLFVGKKWSADTQTSDGLAIHIDFEVVAFGDINVPAGVFPAFTVRDEWTFPKAKTGTDVARARFTDVLGRVSGVPYGYTQRYAPGIGLVLNDFADGVRTNRLLAMHTVGVDETTWTGIRGLYR